MSISFVVLHFEERNSMDYISMMQARQAKQEASDSDDSDETDESDAASADIKTLGGHLRECVISFSVFVCGRLNSFVVKSTKTHLLSYIAMDALATV